MLASPQFLSLCSSWYFSYRSLILPNTSFSSSPCSLMASAKGLFPPQQKSILYSFKISAAFGNATTISPIFCELSNLIISLSYSLNPQNILSLHTHTHVHIYTFPVFTDVNHSFTYSLYIQKISDCFSTPCHALFLRICTY